MIFKVAIILAIWSYVEIFLVLADEADCTLSRVRNLAISDDATLTWDPLPAENCIIDYYLVYIKSGDEEERVYNTTETTMNVDFMQKCSTARFIVIPVSPDGIEGSNFLLITTMPLPPDVNLTLTYLRLSPNDEGVLLEWKVEEEWIGCVRFYRIVIHDRDTDIAYDIYSAFSYSSIPLLVPCTAYDIGVRALYNVQAEGPISLVKYTTPALKLSPPTLRSIDLGSRIIRMSWDLEEYARNRCPLSYFIVDGSPLFNITYPIVDQASRPPVSTQVANLVPNTMYYLRVTVSNSAGASSPVLMAVQTLESD